MLDLLQNRQNHQMQSTINSILGMQSLRPFLLLPQATEVL